MTAINVVRHVGTASIAGRELDVVAASVQDAITLASAFKPSVPMDAHKATRLIGRVETNLDNALTHLQSPDTASGLRLTPHSTGVGNADQSAAEAAKSIGGAKSTLTKMESIVAESGEAAVTFHKDTLIDLAHALDRARTDVRTAIELLPKGVG